MGRQGIEQGKGSVERRRDKGGRKQGAGRGKQAGPSGPAWPILRRLFVYMGPHAGLLVAVVAAILFTTATELAPPWLIRYCVDRFILGGQHEYIWWAAAGLVTLSLVQGGVDFLRLYLMAVTGQRIVFGIRNALFEHLSQLSFSFYDKARTGDLMSRVTADADVLSQFFGRAAAIVLTNILTLIGMLVVLMIWNWQLGLLYLLFLPLIVYGMRVYARRVRPAMGQVRRKLADVTAVLQESLTGIQVVKVFGREAFEEEKVDRQSQAFVQASIGTIKISSLWMPYSQAVMGVFMGLVLWFAGKAVIEQSVSLGMLIGFTMYIGMLLRPIRQTGMMLNVFMQSIAAAERVFGILDIEPEVHDAPDAYPLSGVTGHIRLEGVYFSYDGRNEVLCGIDLDLAPGEMVALVGPSGSGKTTLAHLLPRFYEAQKGRITVDGHDIRQVTIKSLRDAIGIAMQTVFLFDASVGENIAYGNPHASQQEIEQAARAVRMHDFIESLPMGYGTPVGERGVRLSGGQKQRIALARVLLNNPRILILDEPTSSVDANTEQRMQQALQKVWANRTTLVIAHRLWTVQRAEQILVLREGRVVERGRGTAAHTAHDLLMAANGFYRELYELQFRGEALGTEEGSRS